ncbi:MULTISPECIES: exosortase family protein XrtF [Flavobacterium]|uniref:Exosortase family protein XrtF n=1 Tax=Flavobacterium tructae TaxID=1114873 RepID=A0A1S1JCZ8_9FLAO|nr:MULTISPECIES: exosortase family protein XrtF [Flavobacterium]MDL2141359.1 exosortase family protein XrtF [Flavobacterium tructae]OHT46143.1 exosortase family protein XrtF [Flavobacterium tructae]OXB22102.1 exosortase family protein XrtF [Flavobacterium tructae]URC14138.1 exosortase family protein XrtF [Flavobacterium sp. B183]
MKKYLVQFKPFLIFIGTFFAAYIGLTLLYKFYLNGFGPNEIDGITNTVGRNVEQLMQGFNCDIKIHKSLTDSWMEVWYNKHYSVRIVEGCNAVSVMILFVAFVLAFSGKFRATLLFIVFGIFSIYVLNVARIAILVVLLFRFPEQDHFLHGTLFPLIIYGFVFLLWIIWVNKFSKYAK